MHTCKASVTTRSSTCMCKWQCKSTTEKTLHVEGSSLFDIDEPWVRHVEVKTESVDKTNIAEIIEAYMLENGRDIFYFFPPMVTWKNSKESEY